jgi:hypothetical protein
MKILASIEVTFMSQLCDTLTTNHFQATVNQYIFM